MKCHSCSAENLPEHNVCCGCASPLRRECDLCGFICDPASRYCGGCGTPLPQLDVLPETGMAATVNASREVAAERRHLTVMFCDLVGSTDLSVRVDPEDLSDIIRKYRQACDRVISRYHGYVARYTGDGLLIYFGYPIATEYCAERAARAALDIVESVRTLPLGPGVSLHTRIGIASGDVVVGEMVGAGSSREATVVGETPNLAARLQDICAPDTVVVSGKTQKLIGGLFEYSDLGYHRLKGFGKPVHVYQVIGESTIESRFEATRGGLMGALVGRDDELVALQNSWQRACVGLRQLVSICGEEGVGKSRLLENFLAPLKPSAAAVIRLYAAPHTSASVLYPVISYWRHFAGIEASDAAEVKLDKLERRLAQLGAPRSGDLVLLATLLALPGGGRFPALQLSPPALKFHTLKLLVSQLVQRCAEQPVILVVEDLHWLDGTTLELLDLVLQESQKLPLSIIVTHRPSYTPRWKGSLETTDISMTRLDSQASRSLIAQICGGKALPEKIVSEILSTADGIPLYIEELTKTILEGPLLSEQDDRFIISADRALPVIPSSLHDSLMTRLDRPGAVKEVAQIGSALGREFRLDLLQAVADKPTAVVAAALDALVEAQLVIRRGASPNHSYLFRHALIQEAAYQSMLRRTRRQLHARIASILEQQFRVLIQGRPDLLARHYTAAEDYERGFRYWFLASQQALSHFAHKEVAVHLRHGLELAEKLPDEVELVAMAFDMRVMLASTLTVLNGPGHADVGEAYQRAYEFCRGREGLQDCFSVKFGLCRYHWATGQIRKAAAQAESMLPLADIEQNPGQFMAVHILLGTNLWHRGESERALKALQNVSDCYQSGRDTPLFFTYMIDFGVFGRFYQALALQSMGRTEEAQSTARASLGLARKLDIPHAIGFGLWANIMVAIFSGRFEECINYADECIPFAAAHGFPEFVAVAKVCKGSASLKLEPDRTSLQLMEEGIEAWERTGFNAWRPMLRGMLAEAYLLLGEGQRARQELAIAKRVMEEQEERQSALFLSGIERQLTRQS